MLHRPLVDQGPPRPFLPKLSKRLAGKPAKQLISAPALRRLPNLGALSSFGRPRQESLAAWRSPSPQAVVYKPALTGRKLAGGGYGLLHRLQLQSYHF
jgi:hypothetical protein